MSKQKINESQLDLTNTNAKIEEQVSKLEAETGLTRVMREMVLTENSGASDYVKAKANEIEDLAKQLRVTEETSETETFGEAENPL